MEQITHYATLLKGILDAKPWIWHGIQVFFLFVFLSNLFIPKLNKSIKNGFYLIAHLFMLIIIYVYNEISIG